MHERMHSGMAVVRRKREEGRLCYNLGFEEKEMNVQLYRGNLHKVPDVPRRWPLSKPSIPLHVFKKAITKRQEVLLAKENSGSEHGREAYPDEDLTGDQGDHDHDHDHEDARKRKRENGEACGMELEGEEHLLRSSERKVRACDEVELGKAEDISLDEPDDVACGTSRAGQSGLEKEAKFGRGGPDMRSDDLQTIVAPDDSNADKDGERLEAPRTPAAKDEDCTKSMERMQAMELDAMAPCEEAISLARRRAELQEQLKQLQEAKHQLVQILKQTGGKAEPL